jgi:hypothetical protein
MHHYLNKKNNCVKEKHKYVGGESPNTKFGKLKTANDQKIIASHYNNTGR